MFGDGVQRNENLNRRRSKEEDKGKVVKWIFSGALLNFLKSGLPDKGSE